MTPPSANHPLTRGPARGWLLASALGVCFGCEKVAPLDSVNRPGIQNQPGPQCPTLAYDWSAPIAGPNRDFATSLAVDTAGNLLVAAVVGGARFGNTEVAGNAAVEKYSATGDPIWAHGFDLGNQGQIWSLGADALGNTTFVGTMTGNAQIGIDYYMTTGLNDMFVAKLDPQGNFLWSRGYGGDGDVYSVRGGIDNAGNVILASSNSLETDYGSGSTLVPGSLSLAKIDPHANSLWDVGWQATIGGGDISLGVDAESGDFVVAITAQESIAFGPGVVSAPSQVGYDVAVTKFSWMNQAVWTHPIRNATSTDAVPYLSSIAILPSGDVALAGSFDADSSIELDDGLVLTSNGAERTGFLAVLSGSTGKVLAHRVLDDMKLEVAPGLMVSPGPGNTIAVTGGGSPVKDGTIDFGGGPIGAPPNADPNGWGGIYALYGTDFHYCTALRWGDGAGQQGNAIALRPNGGLAFAGENDGNVTIGTADTYSAGTNAGDGLIVTLAPAP